MGEVTSEVIEIAFTSSFLHVSQSSKLIYKAEVWGVELHDLHWFLSFSTAA